MTSNNDYHDIINSLAMDKLIKELGCLTEKQKRNVMKVFWIKMGLAIAGLIGLMVYFGT